MILFVIPPPLLMDDEETTHQLGPNIQDRFHQLGDPNPSPHPNPSPNPRLGSELLLANKMESNDVAKAAMNEIWGILVSLINMADMNEPAGCKG